MLHRARIVTAMCRAVWVIVVAPTDEACKALRRAAGVEVQVVAMAATAAEARALLDSTPADAVVMDAGTPGARDFDPGERGFVWVGDDAPARAHAQVATPDADELPSAITRALIARRKAPS
jgi:DNA-binding NarL/FixJ family response regulator